LFENPPPSTRRELLRPVRSHRRKIVIELRGTPQSHDTAHARTCREYTRRTCRCPPAMVSDHRLCLIPLRPLNGAQGRGHSN